MKLLPMMLAALIAMPVAAQAQGRLDKIKETGQITLGVRESSIPFSYLDDAQKPVGYSIDICHGIVDALKQKLGLEQLQVKQIPVTSSTRIPLVANGTVDISCGSATNNEQRQQQVSFAPTTFVTSTRFASLKSSGVNDLADLKGATVISTAGTSNLRWLTQVNAEEKLGMRIMNAKDHSEAFLTVNSGRAVAFFMDDILLAGLVANSRNADDWTISEKAYTVEPYGMILPKDDPEFKQAVDEAVKAMMQDGRLKKMYQKWFTQPIPPRNINLNWPMSAELEKVIANPTDSPRPEDYK
ncbi:amino acid ABC transporter substrate-binding protein [Pusillimonas noertemannii]|uniref:Amino acid ABC transporter substrate-binding protein (PAAT family) n=1 Tax=Pusillimonas noertemannii TaxID=305977 RepID=A0A2U1CJX5_9BURK|nr:amino acid ABC transporter substrate-binding protein [Pusillimonas noertemannii]NYT69788.1 amino acid ABC transporter substrate-binding protein [Pusillimonas noertemannii]PVY61288.1 amino acid ABC transporter substrate-binding protein (PAAT family) [Pusillimonas noertemannii]TFL09091.1 amino acid ABC transporter substrate-binding protein [Pusillimonas noertemannii]